MDSALRQAARTHALDPRDPEARALWLRQHLRSGARDPRRSPRDGDVVQVGATARIVRRVDELPRGPELLRFVELDDVAAHLRAHGWAEAPNGTLTRWTLGERWINLRTGRHRPSVGWDIETAFETLTAVEGRTLKEVMTEFGVDVNGVVRWELAGRVNELGWPSMADGERRPWGSKHRGRHRHGHCTLAAWVRWATGGEVLRLAEELSRQTA